MEDVKTMPLNTVEKRSFIDKIKNLKEKYMEKMIKTGKSKELEADIENLAHVAKTLSLVGGAALTVVFAACPVDGPVGEIVSGICTTLAPLIIEIKKKGLITTKRALEKRILNTEDGVNKNVKGFDFVNGKEEIVQEAKDVTKGVMNVVRLANDTSTNPGPSGHDDGPEL